MHKILKYLILIFLPFFFTACATTKIVEESFIVPPIPEEPRIMYLKTYRGSSDLEVKSGFDKLISESGGFGVKSLVKPYGVAAKDGKIYVADTGSGVVFVFDTILKKLDFLGDRAKGKLTLPVGIAFDGNNRVYVSDSKLQRVFAYDDKGDLAVAIGKKDDFIRPTGIAINKSSQLLYVVDTKGHNVKVFSLDGDSLFEFGERGKGDGEFNFPTNIVVDERNGNVIVADTQNFRVQVFNQEGEFLYVIGKHGDQPGTFSRPRGVAIDSEGHIYVSDASFDNIQVFDDEGKLLLYFGSAGYSAGQFQMPASIAFDEQDRLYVSENFSAKIQVFQYIGDFYKREYAKEYEALMEERDVDDY